MKDFQISKYFTFYEVTNTSRSELLQENRIEAIPHIMQLHEFLTKVIDPICDIIGKPAVSSGFRSEALNKAVGGVKNSRHTMGLAIDLVFPDFSVFIAEKVAEVALKLDIPFHKFILEPAWLHISGGSKLKQFLVNKGGTYVEEKPRIFV